MDDGKFTAVLLEAIKEFRREHETLQRRIEVLEAQGDHRDESAR